MNRKSMAMMPYLLGIGAIFWIVQAGDLEPPGPPAPTMKTLADVEPRTPIHASDLPLTITEPGSYYLAEDITYTDFGHGITIASGDVTIDLMGHSLSGGWNDGISAASAIENVEVKNGTVDNWGDNGVNLSLASYVKVTNVRAVSNGDHGIAVGYHGIISGCIVAGNGFGNYSGAGIAVIDGCHVRGNMCQGNLSGIYLEGRGNRIEENHLRQNDEGIAAWSGVGGNIIVKNSAGDSYVVAYDIHPANDVGPIGSASTSTSPWANIVY